MRRSLAKFSESEASNHTPSLADFTTTTPELKFSLHTEGHLERDDVFDKKQKANHYQHHDGQTNVTKAEWPQKPFHARNLYSAKAFHVGNSTALPGSLPNQLR